jgi:hypothetical protein
MKHLSHARLFSVCHHVPDVSGHKMDFILPEDEIHFVIEHVYDVLDRLATTVEVLAALTSSQDTEIAERANFSIANLQKYRRVHPILYLIIGFNPAPTSIPTPHRRQS